MSSEEVRNKFLKFFEERGHSIIPSVSLVPEGDPTTLLTGSGMQPLIPYLLGEEHPLGKRLVDSQKCFRAEDIEEVGDNRHTTFFEMLGNWSLGDYFKKEQIPWFFEFLTDTIGLDPQRFYVTVFSGDEKNGIPSDEESVEIWQKLFADKGIDGKAVKLLTNKKAAEEGMQGGRIFYYDAHKNWWSRKGAPEDMPPGELGGPDSEVFYEFADVEHDTKFGKQCHPNCECGKFLEIGNSVFMEYKKGDDGRFEKLTQKNVDFGGGLERITAVSGGTSDVFQTDLFRPIMDKVGELKPSLDIHVKRVFADHLRGASFLRRVIAYQVKYDIGPGLFNAVVPIISEKFKKIYPEIKDVSKITAVMEEEGSKFRAAINRGLKELKRYDKLTPAEAFHLYESYGLPFELVQEFAPEGKADHLRQEDFDEEFEKHKEISRSGVGKKFGGHGLILDTGELRAGDEEEVKKATRLHTATHLLQAALREVLGDEIKQKGSDITAERTRFDFSFPRKLTGEEIKKVEDVVNDVVKKDMSFKRIEMSFEEAKKSGALYVEGAHYPEIVSVYFAGEDPDSAFSKEICGGPHVEHTGEIGKFVIKKEQSVSAGVRRIRADVE
jgi:alanyl-tRNA synthetase